MRLVRNPFYLRATHQISSERDFLRLYSAGVLDALPEKELWNCIGVLRSAPGCGKTSLLRLLTPAVLHSLHSLRRTHSELFGKLKSLGVITEEGPRLLGAMLSCAHDYPALENLEIDPGRKSRALISLLNARIIISVLRSALSLRNLRYPEDLDRIQIQAPEDAPMPSGVPLRGTGREYYDWACALEQGVCETIDSLEPPTSGRLVGHDSAFALWLFQPHTMTCDGKQLADRILVMLDDVQKLSSQQRTSLLALLIDSRAPTPVWLAERIAALDDSEVLSHGARVGRDLWIVILEDYWLEHYKRFEAFAQQIADRRAEWSSDGQIGSFAGALSSTIENGEFDPIFKQGIDRVSERVQLRTGNNPRYETWLKAAADSDGSLRDSLLGWRALEILIERDLNRSQQSFDFETLSEDALKDREEADIRAAAELFVHNEHGLPYYYGFSRLAAIASGNIEQFLDLAGELFERISAASLLSRTRLVSQQLPAEAQETVTKLAVQRRWQELVRPLANSAEVRSLLESIALFCQAETYRSTAPYSPGVSGIAITMADRDRLMDSKYLSRNTPHARVKRVLAECIASNLLIPVLDYKCKGQRWMVLYLNRMLCVQFDLALQYGGWRQRSLNDVAKWLERPFTPGRPQKELL